MITCVLILGINYTRAAKYFLINNNIVQTPNFVYYWERVFFVG